MDSSLNKAQLLIDECKKTLNPTLDLGNCGIESLYDVPSLFLCIHLETLILSRDWWESGHSDERCESANVGEDNVISMIPNEIGNLQNLKKLIITGVHTLEDINFVKKLPNLSTLYAAQNKIQDITPLENLRNLSALDLWDNPITDYSSLSQLSKLKVLSIGNDNLINVEALNKLVDLESLEIVGGRLVQTDFLEKLSRLKYLLLTTPNDLDAKVLSHMSDLEFLTLNDARIHNGRFLGRLTNLKFLKLLGNGLRTTGFLKYLTKLDYLIIRRNPVIDISSIVSLQSLGSLTLESLRIKNWSYISLLNSLEFLSLRSNRLVDVKFLSNLTNLKWLNLSENHIRDLGFLQALSSLCHLALADNRVKEVPRFIFELQLSLNWGSPVDLEAGLYLVENNIEYPPIEILKQGYDSIFEWFDAVKKKLNEIKIVLIGDPKAGKTSILKRLKEDTFNKDEVQTDGINIEKIHFGSCPTFIGKKLLSNLTGHFWDFGGQEIMNATHQFFLTNRSLYVLILDARKDSNIASQIRQWVKRIKATGGDSPIIVIANQIDVNPGFGFSNEFELQQEFPQIKSFIKVSCDTSEGIEALKEKLEELIPQAELFNTEIDERWIKIKEELQKETHDKHFLDESKFIEICNSHELYDKVSRTNAITFLHDLGLVLHFHNLNLSEYYVLDPYWITYGVYQIVTSSYAGRMKGVVDMERLEYIVNEEEDKKEVYRPANFRKINYDNPNQRRFLVDILNEFKLCFYKHGNNAFIIPDLLDTKEPLDDTEPIRNAENAIRFVYEYEYLPNSIVPYVMVEANHLISKMWRTGCVLIHSNSSALITRYENRISITVCGEHKQKRDFMAVVRHLIESINQKISDKPRTLIPLPGINAYAEYDVLLRREAKGRQIYIHDEDKSTEREFDISELLEGIPSQDEVKGIRSILEKSDKILTSISQVKISQGTILAKLNHYEKLLDERLNEHDFVSRTKQIVLEMNAVQKDEISKEVMLLLSSCFELFGNDLDGKLKGLYEDLKQTDDINMKLSLSIPFIKLLGIDFGVEFDVKSWANKMYNKYELNIFKAMGMLN